MEQMELDLAVHTQSGYGEYVIARVQSLTSNAVYTVDMTNGRCSCPAWKFARRGVDGKRAPCKHMLALGVAQSSEKAGALNQTPKVQPLKSSPQWDVSKYAEAL